MSAYVAFLRAVNVGGANKVSMNALRTLVEKLGCGDVRTYIQSGNVVFTVSPKKTTASLEREMSRAIERSLGLTIDVMVRDAAALKRVVTSNPFSGRDLSMVHIGFMASKPSASAVKALDAGRFAPEEVVVRGSEVYFFLPNGMGRARVPTIALKQLQVPTTVRNWTSVSRLLELAGG